jgi:hypothetical protein
MGDARRALWLTSDDGAMVRCGQNPQASAAFSAGRLGERRDRRDGIEARRHPSVAMALLALHFEFISSHLAARQAYFEVPFIAIPLWEQSPFPSCHHN